MPAFGIISHTTASFANKPIFGKLGMIDGLTKNSL